jgi:GNAT superfamily N-acetyltransferase
VADAAGGVRPATEGDNAALLALSSACPMEGDVGLCVDRSPDFFALNRLEGEDFEVGVVDGPAGSPVGCIAVAERRAHLHGAPATTMYVGDLKVLPGHRGTGVADALSEWARDRCRARGGDGVPTLVTILAGNRSMQRRLAGVRGLPHLHRFATVRSWSVSLLWRRRPPSTDVRVTRRAGGADVEEMAALWQRVAPERQFTAVHDAASLAAWVGAAPGLDLSCYLLARRPDGRLAGFLALWDQESFKQLRVTSYSRRLAAFRAGFNALAPLVGATRLPPAGDRLRTLTAVHVCVPPGSPDVLRALLVTGYNELRGHGYSFFTVGLDVTDPLTAACRGLLAQPTDVWACEATLAGERTGRPLDDRPLHHEIALV